jgi:hypothetical protein
VSDHWELPDAPEMRDMLRDVRADIKARERELAELRESEAFLASQLETRRRVSLEQVRDWFREHTDIANPATIIEVAAGLDCSVGQIAMKGYLDKLVASGTIVLVLSDMDKRHRYRFDAPEHKATKTFKRQNGRGPRIVSGVPLTGRNNPKVVRRQGKIKGTGGH